MQRKRSADAAVPRLARNAAAGAGTAGARPGTQRSTRARRTATGESGAGATQRATRAPSFGLLASRKRTHRKVSCPAATLPVCLPPERKDSAPGAMAPTPLRREQRQRQAVVECGGTSAAQAADGAAWRARLALRGARQPAAAAQRRGERGGRPPGVAAGRCTSPGPSFGPSRVGRTHRCLRRRRPHQHAERGRSGERSSAVSGDGQSERQKGRASETRAFRLRASRASSLSRRPRGQGPAQPAAGAGRGAARRACQRATMPLVLAIGDLHIPHRKADLPPKFKARRMARRRRLGRGYPAPRGAGPLTLAPLLQRRRC